MVYSNNLKLHQGPARGAPDHRGGTGLIEHDPRAMRYLRDVLPAEWNRAASAAALLASRARYLPWQDRARAFDEFYWAEARRRLATDAITAIVNRQSAKLAQMDRIEGYGRFCGAVTAAVLLQLDERHALADEAAALIHYFSRDPGSQGSGPGLDRRRPSSGPRRQPRLLARLRLPPAHPLAQRQCRELPRPRRVLGGDAGARLRAFSQVPGPVRPSPRRARTARSRGGDGG